jgi:hypothetical protein
MKKVICNNQVIINEWTFADLPSKDDIITWGSLRYIVLRREFHDNGDVLIIVSAL